MRIIDTTPKLQIAKKPVAGSIQFTVEQIASPELQEARLATCAPCKFNQNGNCKQCCGGVPVKILANLKASRCGRNFWKG